ncbi:MAG: GNAT family N-acetyltransferase, partial [Candidatus Falkowbacteria bacterium]|nr:GNAT family N-acetyltransferase [Candidatus Falkowbacteria bacterium]
MSKVKTTTQNSKITFKVLSKKISAKKLHGFYQSALPGKTLNQCQDIIKKSSMIVGAFAGEKLIGIGRGLEDSVYAFITDVIVDRKFRKLGIGTKIVKILCEELMKKKIKIIHCSTEK